MNQYDNIKQKFLENKILTITGRISRNALKILEMHPLLFQELIDETSFLPKSVSTKIRLRYVKNDITKFPTCPTCSGPIIMQQWRNEFRSYCSIVCSSSNPDIKEKIEQTFLANYGVKHPSQSPEVKRKQEETNLKRYNVKSTLQDKKTKEKIKQTNLKRYGYENPFQSDEIKKRIKKTNLKKYGYENPMQSNEIRQKGIATNLKRYNVENPFQSDEFKQKSIQTNLKRRGVKHPSQSPEVIQKSKLTSLERYNVENPAQAHISPKTLQKLNNREWLIKQHHTQQKTLTKIAKELSVSNHAVRSYFLKYDVEIRKLNQSQSERDLLDFISSIYNKEVITNTRQIITPYELDIYLPDLNLAFEFDGLYWHSELNGKDKYYHSNKTNLCEQQNIRLIHIFENEWILNQDIVQSRIRNLLNANERKIYARKTTIEKLTSQQSNLFLNDNHIQGSCASSIDYGLFHKDELLSVMTFGKSRFNKKVQYELLRFCNTLNTSVVGGASKLFKRFIKKYDPKSIISYSDKRWNTGNLYKQLGFEFSHNAKPNYFYFKNHNFELYSRIQFQKHKLHKKLEIFDPKLTEWQNMQINDYDRIWDCGNSVWMWSCL